MAAVGDQSISSTRQPVRKSQNFIFPSSPQLITVLFNVSTVNPLMAFLCFPSPRAKFLGPLSFLSTTRASFNFFACAGVKVEGNRWRWIPDCRLNIEMLPPAEPTSAKVPHAVTATFYISSA